MPGLTPGPVVFDTGAEMAGKLTLTVLVAPLKGAAGWRKDCAGLTTRMEAVATAMGASVFGAVGRGRRGATGIGRLKPRLPRLGTGTGRGEVRVEEARDGGGAGIGLSEYSFLTRLRGSSTFGGVAGRSLSVTGGG